jgi:hypothetical protein
LHSFITNTFFIGGCALTRYLPSLQLFIIHYPLSIFHFLFYDSWQIHDKKIEMVLPHREECSEKEKQKWKQQQQQQQQQ